MGKTHVFRSQAIIEAQRAGYHNFRTMQNSDGLWKASYEPGESPAEGWQDAKDYVNNVETDWKQGEGRPTAVGVLVVTCRLDEIPADDMELITKAGFVIEPITPSLFDAPGSAANTGTTGKRARPDGSAPRAKSDVGSPVKLVWETADSMPGAERKDVIAACVALGVNKATASTQFYRWQKAREAE